MLARWFGHASLSCALLVATSALAAEPRTVELSGHIWTLPADFDIEIAAGPPLVDRPITADFDEQGRLYVSDSSGSNDKVDKQLAEKPHRVVRLEDTDGDGRFDKSVVYADRLMFPEGTMWFDGSLYVAAPPSIWKLTDTDGDGTADKREEWFLGKTLTGCANDLHGPYLGHDGMIYWCKGAFAEQTYERPGRKPLVTKASHIFRCRPDAPRDPATGAIATSAIESVMTGGMDNPVDCVFTADGERILTNTFFVHPGGGLRDGLIHAIYGGVYGKVHGVLDGHPRTGEIMPVLAHLGPAAPCGMACYESGRFGPEFAGNLFACCFNMHKVTRHALSDDKAALAATTEDFLVSSNIDFHPTDAQEDADGSLLVVDTGGWYKLCCPTSQLWKPDVLGAIYRLRRRGAHPAEGVWADPRGKQLAWDNVSPQDLTVRLGDPRPAVRKRTLLAISRTGTAAIPELATALKSENAVQRLNAVWALTRLDHADARSAVRTALADRDKTVRRAALNSISLWRDKGAAPVLLALAGFDSPEGRLATESLGRIGDASAVGTLLSVAPKGESRAIEHALIYALMEIGDAAAIRQGLSQPQPRTVRAAAIALDQMDGGGLEPQWVAGLLGAESTELRETAAWLIGHHPEWGDALAGYLGGRLKESISDADAEPFAKQLALFTGQPSIQNLLAETASSPTAPRASRFIALDAMRRGAQKETPASWLAAISGVLGENDTDLTARAVAAARAWPATKADAAAFNAALLRTGQNDKLPAETRLDALAATVGGPGALDSGTFDFVRNHLPPENSVRIRAAAVDILGKAQLTPDQLLALTDSFQVVGPLEAARLLAVFEQTQSETIGAKLLDALKSSPVLTSLRVDALRQTLAKYPSAVQAGAEPLYKLIAVDLDKQKAQLEDLLVKATKGDIRRGLSVFHSTKAACAACHQMGYLGGNIGPDLTKIGKIRTERDLLEAIVFPSSSFVRSYEPVSIVRTDGRVENGILKEDAASEVVLVKSATETIRIPREDIEELRPSNVSVMPAGLGQQLNLQDLADLVAFLKSLQ